jgi:hypothetical protein
LGDLRDAQVIEMIRAHLRGNTDMAVGVGFSVCDSDRNP